MEGLTTLTSECAVGQLSRVTLKATYLGDIRGTLVT